MEKELFEMALKARENARATYSKFKVGSCIKIKNGTFVLGANIENASYPLCNCAERSALFSFYSQGFKKEDIVAFAVVADTDLPCSPCGACRQVMAELLPKNTPIYLFNTKGDCKKTSTCELLPFSFSENDLK